MTSRRNRNESGLGQKFKDAAIGWGFFLGMLTVGAVKEYGLPHTHHREHHAAKSYQSCTAETKAGTKADAQNCSTKQPPSAPTI